MKAYVKISKRANLGLLPGVLLNLQISYYPYDMRLLVFVCGKGHLSDIT